MSPEQAKGEEVDRRSDVWSLGVILYEMVTGRLPFKGDYEQAVVYGILNEDPESMTTLRAGVPMALDSVIAKMLAKDPDLRYQHVDELPADLKAIDLGASAVTSRISTSSGLSAPTAAVAVDTARTGRRRAVIPVIGAVALLLGLLGGFLLRGGPPEIEKPVRRYAAVDPARVEGLENPLSMTYAYISPDGRRVAFNADGKLWIRSLDNLRAVSVPGTEGAGGGHEWTRDSRAVGYAEGGSFRRVLLSNNEVTAIGDTPSAFNWWEFRQDGSIAYLSRNQVFGPVATGVQSEPLTREIPGLAVDRGFADLPDDRGFAVVRADSQGIEYISIVASDETHDVVTLPGDSEAKDLFFVSPRFLLFTVEDASRRRSEVWAVQLDFDRMERIGEPRMVVQNARDPSASNDGTLLFLQSGAVDSVDVIVFDRDLRELRKESTSLVGATAPELSPDGKYISVTVFGSVSEDVWILDRMLGGYFQLSFDVENPWRPAWSPDGRMLAYHSRVAEEGTAGDIYVQSIDDGSAPTRLVEGPDNDWAPSWSPDGGWIVYTHRADSGGVDTIYRVRADGSGDPVPVLTERFPAQFPGVSPDGRFVTYHGNRSGQWDVYVSTYPDGDRHFRVTNGGAGYPKWKGDYIYYFDFTSDAIMSTRVVTMPAFRTEQPVVVATAAQLGITIATGATYNWDVSADGREIVVVRDRRSGATPQAIAVENWLETVDF